MNFESARRFPLHGWTGLALIAVFWTLNWGLDGLRTHWLFFPLWLGFCLAVDGLCVLRRGTSLLTRGRLAYVGLFLVSVPVWWLFEVINWRTQNWHYLGRESIGDLEYVLLASLSFSTVVPAVLGAAELCAGTSIAVRFERGPVLRPHRRTPVVLVTTGLLTAVFMLAWPRFLFPFVWLSVWFLLEGINLGRGYRSPFEWTGRGNWRPVAALGLGVLICGFFWEMWNWPSYPKWVYTVPFVGFWHVFEMPLAGYLGYLPFSLELFAAVHFVMGLFGKGRSDYVVAGLVR